jgi:hypothetical protein
MISWIVDSIWKVIDIRGIMVMNEVAQCTEGRGDFRLYSYIILRGVDKNPKAVLQDAKDSFNNITSRCMLRIE